MENKRFIDADKLIEPTFDIEVGSKTYTLDGKNESYRRVEKKFNLDPREVVGTKLLTMKTDDLISLLKCYIYDDISDDDLYNWIIDFGVDDVKYLLIEFVMVSSTPKKKRLEEQEKQLEMINLLQNYYKKMTEASTNFLTNLISTNTENSA